MGMRGRRTLNVCLGAFILAGYYGFVRYTGTGIPCLFRYIFHVKCPGCGVTHKLTAMADGNLLLAFYSHPVLFIFSPFLVWLLGRAIKGYIEGNAVVWKRWENTGMSVFLAVLLMFTVIRNIADASYGLF